MSQKGSNPPPTGPRPPPPPNPPRQIGGPVFSGFQDGLSLRDFFAAVVIHALISGRDFHANSANLAYQYADRMLKEREL